MSDDSKSGIPAPISIRVQNSRDNILLALVEVRRFLCPLCVSEIAYQKEELLEHLSQHHALILQ